MFALLIVIGASLLATGFYFNLLKEDLNERSSVVVDITGPRASKITETTISLAELEGDDPSIGEGSVILIGFLNYECSACEEFYFDVYPKIKENYIDTGKIKYIQKNFVESASKKAEAAKCAQEQGKYWEFHDRVFKNSRGRVDEQSLRQSAYELGLDMEQFDACLGSGKKIEKIQKGMSVGKALGIETTPSFVIVGHKENINGAELSELTQITSSFTGYEIFENPSQGIIVIRITGSQSYEVFQGTIDLLL